MRCKLESKDDAQRFHPRLVNAFIRAHAQAGAAATRPAARGDHRRRRHRRRTGGRAAPHDAPGGGLRARPHRRREGHPDQPDRGRRPRPAGASAERCRRRSSTCCAGSASMCTPRRRWPRCRPTACGSPTAACCRPSWWCGRPASRRADFLKGIAGLESNRNNQLVVRPTLQTTRDDDIFAHRRLRRLRLARSQRRQGRRYRRAPRPRTSRPRTSRRRSAAAWPASRCEPYRYRDFGSLVSLGEYSTVGNMMGGPVGGSLMIEGAIRATDVRVALQDARAGAARGRRRSRSIRWRA